APLAGDAADPRHLHGPAPRGERRRSPDRAQRRAGRAARRRRVGGKRSPRRSARGLTTERACRPTLACMTTTDYALSIALILVVVRQLRGRRLAGLSLYM